jgi:hypothetical protein
LGELGDGDEGCQVSQVGALVVELDQAIVLGIVSLAEGLKGIIVAGCCESELARREMKQERIKKREGQE